MNASHESESWTSVYVGDPMTARILRATLEAEGIQAFAPDDNMKTIDPFVTGAGALSMHVLVPAASAQRALEVIHEAEEAGPGPPEGRPTRAMEQSLGDLGARVRWSALLSFFPLFLPLGVYLSCAYLARASGLETKPPAHGMTLAAVVLTSALTLVWTGLLATGACF